MNLNFTLAEVIQNPEFCCAKNGTLDVISHIRTCHYEPAGMVDAEDLEHTTFIEVRTKNSDNENLYLQMGDFEKLMRSYGVSTPKDMIDKQVIAIYAQPKLNPSNIDKVLPDRLCGFLVVKGSLEVKLE